MEKVNIKDNNHHHKVQQDFFTSRLAGPKITLRFPRLLVCVSALIRAQ